MPDRGDAVGTMLEIDREFQALCPPLQSEEREQLEVSLVTEGCRERLSVWNDGTHVLLLDGHNRYAICTQHNIPYELHLIDLDSREDAINWIIANQLGRRNLTPEQKSYLRGKRYNLEKQSQGGDHKSKSKNDTLMREKLAEEYVVSPATITNDGQFATAVDTLEAQVRQDIRDTILRRQDREEGKITKQQAMHVGKLVQERTVEVQPFMQRDGWKPYHVLEALAMLEDFTSEECAALNHMLDEPFIPPRDVLKMLGKIKAMSHTQRERIYTLARSDDLRDKSDAKTLAIELPPAPDPQVIVAMSLIHEADKLRDQQKRNWRRVFPHEPWIAELDVIDADIEAIQEKWRALIVRIKTSYAQRMANHAETFKS